PRTARWRRWTRLHFHLHPFASNLMKGGGTGFYRFPVWVRLKRNGARSTTSPSPWPLVLLFLSLDERVTPNSCEGTAGYLGMRVNGFRSSSFASHFRQSNFCQTTETPSMRLSDKRLISA